MAMRIPSNAAPGFHPAPRPLCPVGSLPALAEEYGQYQGEDSAAGAAPHPGGDCVAGAQYAVQRRVVWLCARADTSMLRVVNVKKMTTAQINASARFKTLRPLEFMSPLFLVLWQIFAQ